VNVTQQIGAAVGLAVLVTVFGDETKHAQLGVHVASALAGGVQSTLVHGLDDVFRLAAVFALMALVLVAVMVRSEPRRVPVLRPAPTPVEVLRPVVATRTVDLAARSAGAPVSVAWSAEAATACSPPFRPI
jgi:hypothetical protein